MARKDCFQVNIEKSYADILRLDADFNGRTYSEYGRLIFIEHIKRNNLKEKYEKA